MFGNKKTTVEQNHSETCKDKHDWVLMHSTSLVSLFFIFVVIVLLEQSILTIACAVLTVVLAIANIARINKLASSRDIEEKEEK